jgi:hypothetical protein
MVADGSTLPQLGHEVERPVEVGHLDVGRTDCIGYVCVAAGTGGYVAREGR